MKKVLHKLNLVKLGRNAYNPQGKQDFQSLKLEVWPGYVTACDEYEGGLLLTCDVIHKVLRTETVYDYVSHGQDKCSKLKALLGSVVITRYNNKYFSLVCLKKKLANNLFF